jgi:hypothetical protein
MSERSERIISTVGFAHWCTAGGENGDLVREGMVHQ